MFKLWMVQTLLSLLVLLDQTMAQTPMNVTVDNTDPSIAYVGNWEPSVSHTSGLDIGGSHTLSEDATASATFTFTGVAVYYLAPEWPYTVNSYVSLDGGAPALVDMTGPAQNSPNGEETVQSAPRWSATGLSNGSHRVVVTRGPSGYAVVDGFIYTTQSAGSITTSQGVSTVLSTTTVQPGGTGTQVPSTPSDTTTTTTTGSSTNSTVIIAVAVSAGIVCLILLIILGIVCMRRRENTDTAYRHSGAFASGGGRRSTYNNRRQAETTYSANYSAVPLTAGHPYTYTYPNNNNAGSGVAGMEMGTRDSRYSAVGYSDSTGSASGAGSLSAQQQMSYANVQRSGQDVYGLYPISNRALVVPAADAAYNTGGSGTGTDWYNASAAGAGGGHRGGDPGGHNAAAAYAGVTSGSGDAVAPPNPPASPPSAKARFEGSHTPYSGGSNAEHSAYASTSTVAVGAPLPATAPVRQPSPASEKARYNSSGAGVFGLSTPHPYNAAGPISPSEPPPSYAERPGPSGSRPTPSSPPRPNKRGFI